MLPQPSAALMKFVRERAVKQTGETELRRSKRYAAVLEVVVLPLNEHYRPSGLPFLALTRDVSTGGLCMLHTRPAPSTRLFIEIERPNDTALDVVLNVRRNRRVGQFFEIAGDFVTIDDEALAAAKVRVTSRRPDQSG
jgi:PilZ domain